MKNIFLALLILAGGVALMAAPSASAQMAAYSIGLGATSRGAAPRSATTLIQDGLFEADISVARYFGTNFVDIRAPHTAFVLKAATNAGNLVVSNLTERFIVGASASMNSPSRWFSNGIYCEVCGADGGNPNLGPRTLSFSSLDGLSGINDFVANSSGYQFSVNGVSIGSTGNVAAVTAISEPENYGLMLAGLGLMGFVASRKLQKGV